MSQFRIYNLPNLPSTLYLIEFLPFTFPSYLLSHPLFLFPSGHRQRHSRGRANLYVCNQGGRKQLIPSLLPIVIQSNVHIICKLLCLCLPHVPTLYRMFIFLLQYNLSKLYIYSFRGWKSVNVVRKRPEARTIIPPTHPVYVCLQHHMRPL